MFAYKRLNQLFCYLFVKEYCSGEELATAFAVSKRTIRNDIRELNIILESYQAKIVSKRNKGYVILHKKKIEFLFTTINSQVLPFNQQLENSDDRMKQLLLFLLLSEKPLTLDEMCQKIFVGRTTTLSYLRQLRLLLNSYNLKISAKTNIGYRVTGDESSIRQVISDQLIEKNFEGYISQFSNNEKKLFKAIDLAQISNYVACCFPPNHYKISDYKRKNFVIHLAIAILRIKQEQPLETSKDFFSMDQNLQHNTEKLLTLIEADYQITFAKNDTIWLANHLFSEFQHNRFSQNEIQQIDFLIQQMLLEIKEIIGEDLLEDSLLKKDLFVHFSSYLSLKNLVKNKKNPLLSEIKKNYSYPFELAVLATNNSKCLATFEFTEDDIGYLALHIAVAIERKKERMIQKKRSLIICGQGVSTSRLIEAIIKKHFSDQVEIVDIVSYAMYQMIDKEDIDFIITTVPIAEAKLPLVEIDFLEVKKGLEKISVLLSSLKEKQAFSELFGSSLFIVDDKETTREDLIHSIGTLLVEKKFAHHHLLKRYWNVKKLHLPILLK